MVLINYEFVLTYRDIFSWKKPGPGQFVAHPQVVFLAHQTSLSVNASFSVCLCTKKR